uniref:Phenazine biosynthesis protein n=1 Tax=Solanum tuberosum TaxID=4113 RepID=M1E0Q8_SOLTU
MSCPGSGSGSVNWICRSNLIQGFPVLTQDPVCGSDHCAFAPYWCKKLGKCDFVALAVLTHFSKHKD